MVELIKLVQAGVGALGLVAAMLAIWYLDRQDGKYGFEEILSAKIAAATAVFSVMMFTPLIDTQGIFIEFGMVAFPSLKVVADAVVLGFLASALRDLIEREQEK
ncbi:MAG: hypothetical protein ABEJ83_03680 [Candidatus Nanohaloarchaea archaeon]